MLSTRIAVLISGNGTNLQALIDAQKNGIIRHGDIALVISSNPDAKGLKRAEDAGIRAVAVKSENADEFEKSIIEQLEKHDIELIVLAGFLKILSEKFIAQYRNRIINVHPSLIPAFCGKGFYGLRVHQKALEYGVKLTGATVHFVNEIPDGGEIIMQKSVSVKAGDTPQSLQRRVMEEAEWQILPLACEKISKEIMMKKYGLSSIGEAIKDNPYVGRGVIMGKAEKSGKAVSAYFIMGRSENSRNRIFVKENGGLYTKPFDTAKVQDPSLIIYRAMCLRGKSIIVTNGDQTDTINSFIENGGSFEEALSTREFEPDFPNFTPRISGIMSLADDLSYKMSILKCVDKEGKACARFYFNYEAREGVGHIIHTYMGDGNPLPSFSGEPREIFIPESIDDFTDDIWNNLNADNKISLYIRYTDIETGNYEDRLINKNGSQK